MQLIRLLGNKEYVFKCSICHVEIKIPTDRSFNVLSKQELINAHLENHDQYSLMNIISKALLERHGEEFYVKEFS